MTVEYKDSKRIVALSTDFSPTVTTPATYQVTDTSGGETLSASLRTTSAEAIKSGSVLIGKTVSKVEFPMYKLSSPTGTVTAGVFNSSGSLLYTFGTMEAADISTSTSPFTWYAFENTVSTYTLSQDEYVGVRYSGGNSTNRVVPRHDDVSPPFDGTNSVWSRGYDNGNWQDFTTIDASFKLYLATDGSKPINVQDNSILVEKDTARRYWFDASGADTTTTNSNVNDVAHFESPTSANGVIGEQITSGNALIGKEITSLSFWLYKLNSGSSGSETFTFGIWNSSGALQKEYGSVTRGQISQGSAYGDATKHTKTDSDGYVLQENDIIGIRTNSAPSGWTVEVTQRDSDVYSNGQRAIFVQGSTPVTSTKDIGFEVVSRTPATWTMEPTFEDDFSSDNWTNIEGSSVAVSGGSLVYNAYTGGGSNGDGEYRDYGSVLSDTFVWRFKWNATTVVKGSNLANNEVNISISSNTSKNDIVNDAVGFLLRVDSANKQLNAGIWDNTAPASTASTNTTLEASTFSAATYYCEVVRLSNRQFKFTLYSDSNFSTSAYTTTLTNPADLLDLRYFKVTTDHETSADSANDGSLDDFKLYNGVSSIN